MPFNHSASILVFSCKLDCLAYQIFTSDLPVPLGLFQDPQEPMAASVRMFRERSGERRGEVREGFTEDVTLEQELSWRGVWKGTGQGEGVASQWS